MNAQQRDHMDDGLGRAELNNGAVMDGALPRNEQNEVALNGGLEIGENVFESESEGDDTQDGGDDDCDEEDLANEGSTIRQLMLADPLDPARMQLTAEERHWALNIKAAIERIPELNPLSDFEYAQLAIVDRFDVQSAVTRAKHLQDLRDEYSILNASEDGKHFLTALIRLFPGLFLSFSYSQREGCYVLINDITKFDPKNVRTPEKFRTYFTGCFYVMKAVTPDLESIRRGHVLLYECEGYDFKKHMDVKAFGKIWSDLAAVYPCQHRSIQYFHTGMFFNLLLSMTRRLMPPHIHAKFKTSTCPFDGRLNEVFCVPTEEIAEQRLLENFHDTLRRRYENEATFTL